MSATVSFVYIAVMMGCWVDRYVYMDCRDSIHFWVQGRLLCFGSGMEGQEDKMDDFFRRKIVTWMRG